MTKKKVAMNLKQLTQETKAIVKKFPKKYSWNKKDRFIELVEEIGELANAILIEEKKKPKSELFRGNSLVDALSDILFNLLVLADTYGIDLDKEYPKMLKRLEERIKSGEFEE